MFCIIGLGNPGDRYDDTRHNVGFSSVDYLVQSNSGQFKSEKNNLVSSIFINNQKTLVLKPQLYMNRSGDAVREIVKFYKIEASNTIVIHDELDLESGVVKAKSGGGAGGHNGVSDIIKVLGKEFLRIRIGISHPRDVNPRIGVSDWVLQRPAKEELNLLNLSCKRAAQFAEEIIYRGLKPAQEKFHALN